MNRLGEMLVSIPAFLLLEIVEDIQVLIKKIIKDTKKFFKRFIKNTNGTPK